MLAPLLGKQAVLLCFYVTFRYTITPTDTPSNLLIHHTAHPRPVVRKRAIGTLAQFAPLAPPELVNGLLERAVVGGLGGTCEDSRGRMGG